MAGSSTKISFDFDGLKWSGITVDQVKLWERAYPSVDVVHEILDRMPAWMDANPQKARKKNYKRFIVNWLARQEDRYGSFR